MRDGPVSANPCSAEICEKIADARPQSPPARFIGSEIYRHSSYGQRHPLAIPRVSTVIDLCRALDWLDSSAYIDSPVATIGELARFHDRKYLAALQLTEERQAVEQVHKERFNLGWKGNPVFPEMFRRPATACGASLHAARLLIAGARRIYSPAGGTHHGRRDRASGFCFLNDPALAILELLDGGVSRVAYVDLDAHHGDGVQAALSGDPRCLIVSVHEAGRWPMQGNSTDETGGVLDRGGGSARNLPVPAGFNDTELDFLVDAAVLPLLAEFAPDVLIIQCGADALADDPLSKLELSNRALWRAVGCLVAEAPKALVLGGGGYNPWAVARCWTGVWATLTGKNIPAVLPKAASGVLSSLTWRHRLGRNPPAAWLETLADLPRAGLVREEIKMIARAVTLH